MAQHTSLAEGRWNQLSFLEQMANVASEVERYLNWKAKSNAVYSEKSFERALELIDLTVADFKNSARLREILRMREALVDFFFGAELYKSTDPSWRKYFLPFVYAARKNY